MAIIANRLVNRRLATRTLHIRQDVSLLPTRTPPPSSDSNGISSAAVASIVLVVVFITVIAAGLLLCMVHKRRQRNAAHQPENSPKSSLLSKFTRWRSDSNRGDYSGHLQPSLITVTSGDDLSRERSVDQTRDVEMELATSANPPTTTTTNGASTTNNTDATVDRHSSVRSIMTLPPYSVSARPSEQVIAREGERAGVDVVLEHPETVNEEEERRDEEMESLYQIRRARREEAAEREERRRLRREARARGDMATLRRLQVESQRRAEAQAEGATVSAQLIAEHQNKTRERRVSSVQYHNLGVAHHDGSRVRATSIDSDNRPLLSSAASFAGSNRPDSLAQSLQHHRGLSSTSINSTSSGMSGTPDFEVISLNDQSSRSPSFDAGSQHTIPPTAPPEYEDAPPYSSPILARGEIPHFPASSSIAARHDAARSEPVTTEAPQLPMLQPVPSIEITAVSPRP
ncbi:hypothetical protein BT63DRAFT_419267 [Microthyrium microscopicum]|uniref:Uncharacterized protein n=1 Tax=Microthyrium microscopicum TaxID=703497 RepID=A0A6A6TX25_9PEZI|nr:hypothetical protein BT63DRAFT_419267 [Microthyrium microscopicum]